MGGCNISISYISGSSLVVLLVLYDGEDITTRDFVPPPGFSRASRLRTRTVLGWQQMKERKYVLIYFYVHPVIFNYILSLVINYTIRTLTGDNLSQILTLFSGVMNIYF